ncbi:DUF1254 domain-containing protein [Mycolicibacterium setense]|uniref:DUF1254 domain-containing protein n=1 Tax=Mycolicibacterium setense TaxID=431269 RepID=UPI000575CA4F|nr:DUF1254 domain-containing protein [Mycolicibacterium setense]KHO24680.1 cell envelope protein [Mycolicibacterium setense]MCV7110118.1 DUF1254 domain-containing protein [Mycolicibacterium setense]
MDSSRSWHRRWLSVVGIAAIALTAVACGGDKGSDKTSSASTGEVTADQIREIAKQAYIYGFPMVDNYRIQYAYFQDKQNPQYMAPWNVLHSVAKVFTPADTTIQTPNSDTPYSFFGADLRTEPYVLSVPAIEAKRYYSLQFMDQYMYNFDYVGSRTTGNDAGKYLLAGPNWKGEKPAGIDKVLRSETEFAFVAYRTQLFGPDDLDNVKAIQAEYKAEPLSKFEGKPAPTAAPAVDFVVPQTPEEERKSPEFFETLNFVLQFAPVLDTEKELRAKFASIGIGTDKNLDIESLSKDKQEAFQAAITDAWKEYDPTQAKVESGQIAPSELFGNRQTLGTNYLYRMAGAINGIFGNDKAEAMYPSASKDSAGAPLDGANKYTYRYAPGQLPPVNAFWSLTMYRMPQSLLVANPINRYLINSPMLPTLKQDPDGGYTIYVQRETPGPERESNWLPAPEGPFRLTQRLYWPKEAALDGNWQAPVPQKAG